MQVTRIKQFGAFAPYQTIKEDMLKLINRQVWMQGARIPTENALAAKYGVSRLTIRKALKILEAEGVIVVRQGSGRIVAKIPKIKKKAKSIGIICHQFGSAYGEVELINKLAEQHGYQVHLYLLENIISNGSLTQQLQQMTDEDISGIIILCRDILDSQIIEWSRYVPVVAVYHDFLTAEIPSFNINWQWLAYEASCHFFETGFKQQLVLLYDCISFKNVDSKLLDGFNYAHHRYKHQLDDNNIFFIDSHRSSNRLKSLDEVYARINSLDKCAIFTYFSWPLPQIVNYCRNEERAIPEEVALIGAVDTPEIRDMIPAVTGFKINRELLITNAVSSLLDKLHHKQVKKNHNQIFSVYGELIKRSTTC